MAGIAFDPDSLTFSAEIGSFLADSVHSIDLSCNTLMHGVEAGLCNVKPLFAPQALSELGKKLTEETLISWLISKRFNSVDIFAKPEQKYPGSNEECDLVLHLSRNRQFWIEAKLAWRRWYNCNGSAKGSSSFNGYLHGDATHPGAAHDFRKLERVTRVDAEWMGVLLIGFDSLKAPMDSAVKELEACEKLVERGWSMVATQKWTDRRNPLFRINCWFWTRSN